MTPDEQEEYELAVQAQSGDLHALSALVERLRLRLFATAYADLQHYDDAQDAVASALVRICSHISDLRDAARFRAWMHSIVRNEARRIQRQRTTGASHLSLYEVSDRPARLENASLRLDVEQALQRLPADQAHAMTLFYQGNVSIGEIARRTGRPEGTIKSWLHHGRQQLAVSMKEYAPMTPIQWTAAILSDSLEPTVIDSLEDALRAAGFSRIHRFHNWHELMSKGYQPTTSPDSGVVHLPDALKGTHYLILDQRIGRHSAFELNLILRAAEKRDNVAIAHCILLDSFDATLEEPTNVSVYASWLSGFDLCLSKPVKPEEFERFARRIRENLAAQSA